jgi:hypothetical protein
MNRRKFFVFLGIGAVSAVVPKAIASTTSKASILFDVTQREQELIVGQLQSPTWGKIYSKMDIPNPEGELDKSFKEQERIEKENIDFYRRIVKPALKHW